MRTRRLKNEINVVPYIDVMLVLLVIFMVTAPMMNVASIDLPSVSKASQAPDQALQINIRADKSLSLTAPGKSEKTYASRQELIAAVRDLKAATPDQPVLILGAKTIEYDTVLEVMGELQRNNISRVALLVQQGNSGQKK